MTALVISVKNNAISSGIESIKLLETPSAIISIIATGNVLHADNAKILIVDILNNIASDRYSYEAFQNSYKAGRLAYLSDNALRTLNQNDLSGSNTNKNSWTLFLPAILAGAAADSSAVIDGINQKQWFAERAQPEGVEDWSAVDFSIPYVTLYQDRTDNGPALTSIGLKKVSGKKLKITRTALIHSHITNSYMGKDEFFTGSMGIFESNSSERKGVSALLGLPPLCQVKYMDYEYQGDWDNFILDDHNNPSNFVPSVWDAEFKETFIYNPANGEASYEVNGNRVEAQCKPLNLEFLRIYIGTYGWWTGHYTKIKSFQTEWIN